MPVLVQIFERLKNFIAEESGLEYSERFLPIALIQSLEFAAKKKGGTAKFKDCKKGFPCGYSCQAKGRNCKNPLTGQAANYASWMAAQIAGVAAGTAAASTTTQTTSAPAATKKTTKKTTPKASPQQPPVAPGGSRGPVSSPTATPVQPAAAASPSPVKINQKELDAKRSELEKKFGKTTIDAAEANVNRILNDADTNLYIRVGSSQTLELILGSQFRTAHELGRRSHTIPQLPDSDYLTARARVEAKTLGYDENTPDGDRPIYGYLGGKNLKGQSHSDVGKAYGSIAVKLKPEAKERSTFTGADSFKSGVASPLKGEGPPPPPNAAALVSNTRFGYDLDESKVPDNLKKVGESAQKKQLDKAINAKNIDELNDLAPGGNRYIEAQIHGGVKPSDIAEIHFESKSAADRPTAEVAKFAKENGVDLYINGRKLPREELDRLIPNPRKSDRLNEMSGALNRGDFQKVADIIDDIEDSSKTVKLQPRETDRVLKQLYKEAGYDDKPEIGSEADVTKAWKDGGTLSVRGIGERDSDGKKFFEDFKSGDYYVGSGIYGNGTYVGHAGHFDKDDNYVGYNADTATADAKRAWNDVEKHNYITDKNVTVRMAIKKEAFVAKHSDLLDELGQLDKEIDDWYEAEGEKLRKQRPANLSVGSIRDVKEDLKKLGKADADQVDSLMGDFDKEYSPSKAKPFKIKLSQDDLNDLNDTFLSDFDTKSQVRRISLAGKSGDRLNFDLVLHKGDYYMISDEAVGNGSKLEHFDQFGDLRGERRLRKIGPASDGNFKAIAQKSARILREVNIRTSLDLLQGEIKPENPILAELVEKEAKLTRQRKKLREFLGVEKRNGYVHVSNLAVIKGYDAVALNKSYEKDTFMLLLNRGKVLVQDDALRFQQGQKTGGL